MTPLLVGFMTVGGTLSFLRFVAQFTEVSTFALNLTLALGLGVDYGLFVMLGTLVFVFQEGHFADVLGFTPMLWLEVSIPILMFCVAYGLSMDYEIFMLSRIREEFERTGDNETAVALELAKSGPLITTAAAILALCFLVYVSSSITILKMLGLGIALAILVDATIIRAVLVPAIMTLAGRCNWWALRPLARVCARFGLRD